VDQLEKEVTQDSYEYEEASDELLGIASREESWLGLQARLLMFATMHVLGLKRPFGVPMDDLI